MIILAWHNDDDEMEQFAPQDGVELQLRGNYPNQWECVGIDTTQITSLPSGFSVIVPFEQPRGHDRFAWWDAINVARISDQQWVFQALQSCRDVYDFIDIMMKRKEETA